MKNEFCLKGVTISSYDAICPDKIYICEQYSKSEKRNLGVNLNVGRLVFNLNTTDVNNNFNCIGECIYTYCYLQLQMRLHVDIEQYYAHNLTSFFNVRKIKYELFDGEKNYLIIEHNPTISNYLLHAFYYDSENPEESENVYIELREDEYGTEVLKLRVKIKNQRMKKLVNSYIEEVNRFILSLEEDDEDDRRFF